MNFLTELREGLWIAWDAIRAHKLRSVLTTLGIVIGIVTVTLMGTAIDGLNRAFLGSVSSLGADVLHASRFSWFIRSHAEWIKVRNRPLITPAQVEAVARNMTTARAVAPVTDWNGPASYRQRHSKRVTIIGTTDQFLFTSGVNLTEGRFLSAAEAEGGRPVCVLGWQVATNLFLRESPLDLTLRLGEHSFQVVGVIEPQGNLLGQFNLDNQVFIPIQQFQTKFFANANCDIQVKAAHLDQLDETEEELRGVLRKIRRVEPGEADDFAINQQQNFIESFQRVAGTIALVGLFITGLSLFVGGIGIMNIMFVSVAERTREIGLRKAIGARRRSILVQFLSEAACICLLGGVIALAIAWPATLAMQKVMPARMSFPVAGLALAVAVVTGLVSGFFPAWRAARMNPVEALRNE